MNERLKLLIDIMESRQKFLKNISRHTFTKFVFAENLELNLAEMQALRLIGDSGSTTVIELAEDLARTKGAVSQIIEKLLSKDLIKKQDDPQDLRKKQISLSEKGQGVYVQDKQDAHRLYEHILPELDDLSEKDLKNYIVVNNKLRSSIMRYYNLEDK